MLALSARRYDTGEPVHIRMADECIAAVEPAWPTNIDDWPFVAPGLFDVQINGYGGTWFGDEGITAERVLEMLEAHFAHGITRMCPTLITNSHEALAGGFRAIDEACRKHSWAERMVVGCHLEGPYISPEDGPRGAHPAEHVRPPDWDEFEQLQQAAGGRIRLVTLAPEHPGAIEFIRRAVESGVTVAIGHTAATPEEILAAVDAGARLSTHLGNGAHGVIRRHPNYIWEQLGEERLWASIITDGAHLPGSVIRSILRAKGPLRTIITCDAAGLAGCPPGVYEMGSVRVEILEDGRLVVAGQRQMLAGSGVQTDVCVARAATLARIPLSRAIEMASATPARLLGVEEIRLHRGCRADLFLYRVGADGRLIVEATVQAGAIRHGSVYTR